jgi:glucosylglycerate synthase
MDPSLEAQLQELGHVDLLIGCPAYNSARTIGRVVRSVLDGLKLHFSGQSAVVFVSDGRSTDTTVEEAKRARSDAPYPVLVATHTVHPVHDMAPPYHGVPGKEIAMRSFFEAVPLLGAKVCGVVDADLDSRPPLWVKSLLEPVLRDGFDFVAPLYERHKFDGTISNNLVYPLNRALYGKRIRQFIGGEFALSESLAASCVKQPVWEGDIARFAPDIWTTTLAVTEGFRVCQSFLGPKVYVPKDYPENDLGSMFTQVVSSVFGLMEIFERSWTNIKGSDTVVTFGPAYRLQEEPVPVNVSRMIRHFQLGTWNLMDVWSRVFSAETLRRLEALSRISNDGFLFPDELWVEVVYDSAVAYHLKSVHRDHLLKSLIPIYLGKAASFMKENRESSAEEVEEKIESLCMVFEEKKGDLPGRWDARRALAPKGGGE